MQENLNLAPIEELLTTGISPRDLANELDEILYDYTETIICLHLKKDENEEVIHSQVPDFMFRLKELKDVFRKCAG